MTETTTDFDGGWIDLQATLAPGAVLVTAGDALPFGQVLLTQRHVAFGDVPTAFNGRDSGPDPHEIVLMALGACTAITVRMYAARKGWPIDRLDVRLAFRPAPAGGQAPQRAAIDRRIEIAGPLDAEQRARLLAIAEKCPIHQLLTAGADVHTALAP